MKKNKAGKEIKEYKGEVIWNRMIMEGLSEKKSFEQRLEWGYEARYTDA